MSSNSLKPVVKPGAPAWSGWAPLLNQTVPSWQVVAAFTGLMSGLTLLALVGARPAGPILAAVIFLICLVLSFYGAANATGMLLSGPPFVIERRPITGEPADLLEDIFLRFEYAKVQIGKVPTGIEWSEVDRHVRALLWDAGQHGAEATALNGEIHELRYAERGTPQRVLRNTLIARRDEHVGVMKVAQREAEQLARLAGNAAAAARVALLATGSLRELEVVTPSPQAQLAISALDAAKDHLRVLIDVWTALDPTTDLLAEKIAAEAEQKPVRRKRSGHG